MAGRQHQQVDVGMAGMALQRAWFGGLLPTGIGGRAAWQCEQDHPTGRMASAVVRSTNGTGLTAEVRAVLVANRGRFLTLRQVLEHIRQEGTNRHEVNAVLRKLVIKRGKVEVAAKFDGRRWVKAYQWIGGLELA